MGCMISKTDREKCILEHADLSLLISDDLSSSEESLSTKITDTFRDTASILDDALKILSKKEK